MNLRKGGRLNFTLTRGLAGTRTGVLGLTTVGNLLVRTGSSILLTRLLAPSEFGIVGIITSVFFAVALVTDIGFQDFLVRHDRSEERHFRDVIWTIHATRGLIIFCAIALLSPVIAWALGKSVIAAPLALASLIFAINGVSSLSLMTALRHDKARELSLLDFALQCFQTVVGVLLAIWWRNAWAIIAAMLIQSGVRTILSYRFFADSSHSPARDPIIAREFFKFSRFVMASSALTLVIGQSDKLVLGRVFTLGEFGLYAIAMSIVSAPVGFAESYVNRIIFPICSKTWREASVEIASVYYGVKRHTSALYAVACGGLIGSANLVVALLYDQRYAAAATFISWLMLATALRLPNVAVAQLMVAIGHVERTMHLVIVRVMWVLTAIPVGLALIGPMGVVAAIGLVEVPAMLFSWFLLRRYHILRVKEEALFLGMIAAGAVIGWVGSDFALRLLPLN